jgi:hypothetical protein
MVQLLLVEMEKVNFLFGMLLKTNILIIIGNHHFEQYF